MCEASRRIRLVCDVILLFFFFFFQHKLLQRWPISLPDVDIKPWLKQTPTYVPLNCMTELKKTRCPEKTPAQLGVRPIPFQTTDVECVVVCVKPQAVV